MMKYEIFKDVVENAVLDYLPPEFQNSELHLKIECEVRAFVSSAPNVPAWNEYY